MVFQSSLQIDYKDDYYESTTYLGFPSLRRGGSGGSRKSIDPSVFVGGSLLEVYSAWVSDKNRKKYFQFAAKCSREMERYNETILGQAKATKEFQAQILEEVPGADNQIEGLGFLRWWVRLYWRWPLVWTLRPTTAWVGEASTSRQLHFLGCLTASRGGSWCGSCRLWWRVPSFWVATVSGGLVDMEVWAVMGCWL